MFSIISFWGKIAHIFYAFFVLLQYTLWSIKRTGHYIIGDNFVKFEPIFTIFALLGRGLNFQQNLSNISHFTLTLVPHYLGKLICLKNQSLCTL